MDLHIYKLFFLLIIFGLVVPTLKAQQGTEKQETETPFIQKGTFLTGFSLSFINASREDFNQEFEREFTNISIQLDGLYFLNDRIGLGPLLGYRFTYRDFEDPFRGPGQPDRDTREGQLNFGVKGGWYIPTKEVFGGSGNTRFFVDGGISWLRTKFETEGFAQPDANYQFGFQVGTGFLFPVGKRIALQTKLGFRARQREFIIAEFDNSGNIVDTRTVTRWPKEVALSVGLNVTF